MKQNIELFQNSNSVWQNFLAGNPQLFREVKGRLKPRNVVIAASISLITQFLIIISFLGKLPESLLESDAKGLIYNTYCLGQKYRPNRNVCELDASGHWIINWQLWWLDIFIALSIMGIFALLVIGTYMLISDLVKEETRGTLNFIRLSPQPSSTILTGKILGVPILLYLVTLITLPLHFIAGLQGHIPLVLILSFDAVVIASCIFFYSAALLWSLINFGLSGFKPWLASGAVCWFLYVLNGVFFNHYSPFNHELIDGAIIFYPGTILSYLIDGTGISSNYVSFLTVKDIGKLLFYGQDLWSTASIGIGFILLNYGLWTYWLWSSLKRRFHNPESTLLSKNQSYWLTACFITVILGFTLQTTAKHSLVSNFMMLQCFVLIFFLSLTAALSPHRQSLHDWARYRHQLNKQLNKQGNVLWQELIFGENSPSTIAIAINLAIVTVYILPSLALFSFGNETLALFWGILLNATMILVYAVAIQFMLTINNQNRAIWASVTTLCLVIVPPLCLGFADIPPQHYPEIWLFTFIPLAATKYTTLPTILMSVLGQWLAISLVGLQMTRKLRQAGASETKMFLDSELRSQN